MSKVKSMNANWTARLASTQALLMYPIQSATIFHSQTGWARYGTIAFTCMGGIILNYTIIKDLISLLKFQGSMKDLYKEYAWVVAVTLMNISLFASFYHMFGVRLGQDVLKGDWYNSVYFSVVTWTTLGYGDFAPVENLRLVAALEALMGYFYMALLVGLLLNLFQQTMKPKIASNEDKVSE
jgi:hypothetical protein